MHGMFVVRDGKYVLDSQKGMSSFMLSLEEERQGKARKGSDM